MNLERKFPNVDVDHLEVVLGGGARHFASRTIVRESGFQGLRNDQGDLIYEWTNNYRHGTFFRIQRSSRQLTKIFIRKYSVFLATRTCYMSPSSSSKSNQPILTLMTNRAIELTSNNPKEFFLVIESGRIDHAHYKNNAYNALNETIYSKAAVKLL